MRNESELCKHQEDAAPMSLSQSSVASVGRIISPLRIAVTTLITTLIAAFLERALYHPVNAELFKAAMIPGFAVGIPIGLVAGSRFHLWRTLAHGFAASDPIIGNESVAHDAGAGPVTRILSFLGGLSLRLVSATGVLVSLMTLVCCWKIQQREEILVT